MRRGGHAAAPLVAIACVSVLLSLASVTVAPRASAAPAPVGTVTNHAPFEEQGINHPGQITAGPDGAMWFTNTEDDSIGRVTVSGAVTLHRSPDIVRPALIVAGPDGALWFINTGGSNRFGRITTSGVTSSYAGAGATTTPNSLAAGPDGALWFTTANTTIGRLAPDGAVTLFTDPRITEASSVVSGGNDGGVWFRNGASRLMRITPAGVVTTDILIQDERGSLDLGGLAGAATGVVFTAGRLGNQFVPPRSVLGSATASGAFPFSDTSGQFIRIEVGASATWVWDASTKRLTQLNTGATYPYDTMPDDFAVGPDGHVWATFTAQDKIVRDGAVIAQKIRRPADAVAATPDGSIWFTLPPRRIARLARDGQYQEHTVPHDIAPGTSLVLGADGALWFMSHTPYPINNFVDRIAPTGEVTSFALDRKIAVRNADITPGPDGALWFAVAAQTGGPSYFGRITTKGISRTFLDENQWALPRSITAGKDGALWFLNSGGTSSPKVGRIDLDGSFSYRNGAPGTTDPWALTTGPDGALWYATATNPLTLARLDTAPFNSQFGKSFPAPFAGTVNDIAAGPDGRLWLTLSSGGIVRASTDGVYERFALPYPTSAHGIALGTDSGLWFAQQEVPVAEATRWSIGRIEALGAATVPSAPQLTATGGDGTAKVSWSVGDGGAALSGVTVSLTPGGATCTWVSGPPTCTVGGLVNGTRYTATARATNAIGTGPSTIVPAVVVPHPRVPTPGFPRAASLAPDGACFTVNWWPPSGDPVTQSIIDMSVPDFATGVPVRYVFEGAANSHTICQRLSYGTRVSFRIILVTALDSSDPSAATTPIVVGASVTPGFPVATTGDGSARVSWWPNPLPITGGTITPYVNGVAQAPQSFAGNVNQVVVPGLTNGVNYTFVILLTNATGSSQPATTKPVLVGTPRPPAFVRAATTGTGQMTVSWWPPADNGSPVTSYAITTFVDDVVLGPPSVVAAPRASAVVGGLSPGSSYRFTMTATNAIGTSLPSASSAPVAT
jgi:streptogramin lyase